MFVVYLMLIYRYCVQCHSVLIITDDTGNRQLWLVFWRCSDHSTISRPCCWRTVWESILCNQHHVLYNPLPNKTVSFYELRHRSHIRELINKTSRLAEASFIVYTLYYISHTFFYDFTIRLTFSIGLLFYLYYTSSLLLCVLSKFF